MVNGRCSAWLAAAVVAAGMLAGAIPEAAAQETICAPSHTKIFNPGLGREECVEIDRSLQLDNQRLQEQRQRALERRIEQQQLIRETRTRAVREQAEITQRQIGRQQELLRRQGEVQNRQRRLVTEQRAYMRRLQAEQSRPPSPQ